MSRADARLKLTSSSPRKICPEVGSSRPAIMRKVVVLPQPEGPSRQKNSPLPTVNVEPFTAVKSAKALCSWWTRISAMALGREFRDAEEPSGPEQRGGERPGVEPELDRLHHHHQARGDDDAGQHFHAAAAQPARPAPPLLLGAR